MQNSTTKVQFGFTITVPTDRASRFTAGLLPRVAEFAAVTLPKDFPSLEGNVELTPARVAGSVRLVNVEAENGLAEFFTQIEALLYDAESGLQKEDRALLERARTLRAVIPVVRSNAKTLFNNTL